MNNPMMLILGLVLLMAVLLLVVLVLRVRQTDKPDAGSFANPDRLYRAFKDGKPLAFSAPTPIATWAKLQRHLGSNESRADLRKRGFAVKLIDKA